MQWDSDRLEEQNLLLVESILLEGAFVLVWVDYSSCSSFFVASFVVMQTSAAQVFDWSKRPVVSNYAMQLMLN
jgi:hypothetical protein